MSAVGDGAAHPILKEDDLLTPHVQGLTNQEEAFNARVSAMADWASRKVLSPLMLFASQVVLMNQH